MRVGLQIRLSKQTEIKKNVERKKKKNPTVVSAREKKCRFLDAVKEKLFWGMLKREAEGECSPQRFLTQICNTEHDDTQKSFFVHSHLF